MSEGINLTVRIQNHLEGKLQSTAMRDYLDQIGLQMPVNDYVN